MADDSVVKPVTMMCLTTKKKFDVLEPEVCVLRNGRYAFRAPCPWEGKNGKKLTAFKFCSALDYEGQCAREASKSEHKEESEHDSEDEQKSEPDEPE